MRVRRLFNLLIFICLNVVCGCGTVRNFEGSLPQPSNREGDHPGLIGPPGGRQIYGGVRFDLVGVEGLTSLGGFPAENLIAAYMIGVDLPLSFIADTLTLPWTIKATMDRIGSKRNIETRTMLPDTDLLEKSSPQ